MQHTNPSTRGPDHLAAEFFKAFARFEYALKAAGFHRGNGDAKSDWRRFALEVERLFEDYPSPEFEEAVDYLLSHPPKKQVVRGGQLDWDDAHPQTDSRADLTLLYVRRVRNNLFHGGKFNGRWFAPERSEELMRHSMTVLDGCLSASPTVREAYLS